jgi:hypothetical protein
MQGFPPEAFKPESMTNEEWANHLLEELKPTNEEHLDEIVRVNQNLKNQIIESGNTITGPELIVKAMHTHSLYETMIYGFMAMQALDRLEAKNVPLEQIEIMKDGLKQLLNQKIPIWNEDIERMLYGKNCVGG